MTENQQVGLYQAAKIAGISPQLLNYYAKSGAIPHEVIFNRLAFAPEQVKKWARNRQAKPSA